MLSCVALKEKLLTKKTEFSDAKILIVLMVSAMNFVTDLRREIQRGQRNHIVAFESFISDFSYQIPQWI